MNDRKDIIKKCIKECSISDYKVENEFLMIGYKVILYSSTHKIETHIPFFLTMKDHIDDIKIIINTANKKLVYISEMNAIING